MAVIWDLIIDEEDFTRRVQKEIYQTEIIIDVERRIEGLKSLPSTDDIHRLMEDFFQGTNIESELHTLHQKMEELKQGIQAEYSNEQTRFDRLGSRMDDMEARLKTAAPVGQPSASAALIAEQGQEIEQLHRLLITQSQTIARLQSAIDAQRQENDALKRQTVLNAQQMDALARQSAEQARAMDEIRRQLAALAGSSVSPAPPPLPPKPPAPKPKPSASAEPVVTLQPTPLVKPAPLAQTKPEKLWIAAFSLPKPTTEEAFFRGGAAAVRGKIAQSIQGLDALMIDVQRLPLKEDAGNSFLKNLRQTKTALEKLDQKFNFVGCDEDELSERVTDKFFKIIGDNILDNIMPGIYRGGRDAAGYEAFLQKLNSYLIQHGIYTLDISPGATITGNISDHIEPPILKPTMNAADDGKIDEVELLPYFMNYEDDDGNLEWLRKSGRIIIMKYGEMK